MPGLLAVPSVSNASNRNGGPRCRIREALQTSPGVRRCSASSGLQSYFLKPVGAPLPLPPSSVRAPSSPPLLPHLLGFRSFKLFETLIGGLGAGLRDSRLLNNSHHVIRPKRGLEGELKGSPNFFFSSKLGHRGLGVDWLGLITASLSITGPTGGERRTEPQPSRI